jgi:hypothetical protein
LTDSLCNCVTHAPGATGHGYQAIKDDNGGIYGSADDSDCVLQNCQDLAAEGVADT